MLKSLECEELFETFLNANRDKLVLVKFSATWCPPCQLLQKNIEELLTELKQSTEPKENLFVLEVDVEKFALLAQRSQFNIHSIPTIFLFDQGKLIKKISGNLSVLQLKEFIRI